MAPAFTSQDLVRIVRATCSPRRAAGFQYLWYSPRSRGWVPATSDLDRELRQFILNQYSPN